MYITTIRISQQDEAFIYRGKDLNLDDLALSLVGGMISEFTGTVTGTQKRRALYAQDYENPISCSSPDGLTPEETGKSISCETCPYGNLMWREGKLPECREYLDICMDHEELGLVTYSLTGTALGSWNRFIKETRRHNKLVEQSKRLQELAKTAPEIRVSKEAFEVERDPLSASIRVTLDNTNGYLLPKFEFV